MKRFLILLLCAISYQSTLSQTPDTIPLYDVGCDFNLHPYFSDTSYYYWSQDTLVITHIRNRNCCTAYPVGLLYSANDSIQVSTADTSDTGPDDPICLCDCAFGITFKIPVEADTVYLFWEDEYVVVPKIIASLSEFGSTGSNWIFPNPAKDRVTLTMKGEVHIRNMEGAIVYFSREKESSLSLNDIGLKPGVYVITVNSGGRTYSERLVKQ